MPRYTTIRIEKRTATLLKEAGSKAEIYDQILRRLIAGQPRRARYG